MNEIKIIDNKKTKNYIATIAVAENSLLSGQLKKHVKIFLKNGKKYDTEAIGFIRSL